MAAIEKENMTFEAMAARIPEIEAMKNWELCEARNIATRDELSEAEILLLDVEIAARGIEAELARCACGKYHQSGPVPNYCREHDGDYMSFLAFHNCD